MSEKIPADNSMKDGKVEKVLDLLNKEANQEQVAFKDDKSLLIGKDPNLLRNREREYVDPEKQWVRRHVWLEAAKSILKKKQKRGDERKIRYLTLPAYHRLDVSLFLKEGLLEITRSNGGTPEEVYVAAFENEPTKFALMQAQMPHFKLFGCESIEEVFTDPGNKYYGELRSLFPFDIINLDLTTNLMPKNEGPFSKTMRAIDTIFDLQSGHAIDWALFLTFRNVPDDLETNARKQLFDNLQDNIDKYPEVLEAFQNRYGRNSILDLGESDIKTCISQSIAKWLVDRAHQNKYKVGSIKPYFYARYNKDIPKYYIYKHVLELTPGNINSARIPTKDIPVQSWMQNGLKKCIEQHRCTDVEDVLVRLLDNAPDKYKEISDEVDSLCKMI